MNGWPAYFDEMEFLGNSLGRWGIALVVGAASFLLLPLVLGILRARVGALAKRTATRVDDLIADLLERTKVWLLFVLALYLASLPLAVDPRYLSVLGSVVSVAFILQVGIWASVVLLFAIENYVAKRIEKDAGAAMSVVAIGFVARLVLWALVGVVILQNLGIDVTPIVAGLGVGGIAIALASQHILGDLFASFIIILDKPFVLGDFIIVGDFLGVVEYVGLKTTRVRSLSGEQVVFANTDLLNSRVRNFKRMYERRVVFKVGVTYETPAKMLERIPAIARELIESQKETRFDRAHFASYGDFSIDFEIVYYVLFADYNRYMDIQQAINLGLYRRFEELGIAFAYPTQRIVLERGQTVAAE